MSALRRQGADDGAETELPPLSTFDLSSAMRRADSSSTSRSESERLPALDMLAGVVGLDRMRGEIGGGEKKRRSESGE